MHQGSIWHIFLLSSLVEVAFKLREIQGQSGTWILGMKVFHAKHGNCPGPEAGTNLKKNHWYMRKVIRVEKKSLKQSPRLLMCSYAGGVITGLDEVSGLGIWNTRPSECFYPNDVWTFRGWLFSESRDLDLKPICSLAFNVPTCLWNLFVFQ